jgi:hypothetical protein
MLVTNIDQMHKEIELINTLLRDEFKATVPQPLDGLSGNSTSVRDGLNSNSTSVRRPTMPTPLREMAPAMREASAEIARNDASRHGRNASDSYFPVYGMESAHTIPPQLSDTTARKKPALSTARSEADLFHAASEAAAHPGHRPAVPGQSRFPNFSRLRGYKEG